MSEDVVARFMHSILTIEPNHRLWRDTAKSGINWATTILYYNPIKEGESPLSLMVFRS